MNVLIGGTGFIGSALAAGLVQRGEKVMSIARNAPEKKEAGVEYHIFDIAAEPEKLTSIVGVGATIFLLVGQNYTGFDSENEIAAFSRIVDTIKLLSPRAVFFTSSVLVYGECMVPAREEQSLQPKEQYSTFKVMCEQMIQEKLTSIPVGVLRLGNVYGSEKNKGFIGLVLSRALNGSRILVNGDGLQERDYIFLDEIVSAMIHIKDQLQESDTINVATGESKTLLDIIDAVSRIAGSHLSYTVSNVPVTEVEKSRIDITRLRGKYGFIPRVFLEEGIQETGGRYHKKI